jgi:hypothetical protein
VTFEAEHLYSDYNTSNSPRGSPILWKLDAGLLEEALLPLDLYIRLPFTCQAARGAPVVIISEQGLESACGGVSARCSPLLL